MTQLSPPRSWRSLKPCGFPGYKISNYAEVRAVGSHPRTVRATNAAGALTLLDVDGVKRCRVAGKLCRLVFGPDAPGATVPKTKLSPAQVVEIRTSSEAPTVVAARLGVATSTVKAVRARRTHKSVEAGARTEYQQDRNVLPVAA